MGIIPQLVHLLGKFSLRLFIALDIAMKITTRIAARIPLK